MGKVCSVCFFWQNYGGEGLALSFSTYFILPFPLSYTILLFLSLPHLSLPSHTQPYTTHVRFTLHYSNFSKLWREIEDLCMRIDIFCRKVWRIEELSSRPNQMTHLSLLCCRTGGQLIPPNYATKPIPLSYTCSEVNQFFFSALQFAHNRM